MNSTFFYMFFIILLIVNNSIYAQTNPICTENLEKAEDAYYDENFSETIRLAGLCLKQPDLSDQVRIQSYIILSRTFQAMDQTDKAKEFINKILDLDSNYLPTIEQETPKYVNLVIQVRKEREAIKKVENTGISNWVWYGAGGAVAITAAIVLFSGDEEKKDKPDNRLPAPPNFP